MYRNKKNPANLGRKGDNRIRQVEGQPSHVNALEAYLIDNFGDSGRQATQRMGSGTINPNTGLREYFTIPGGMSFFEEDESGEGWWHALKSEDWFDDPSGWEKAVQFGQDVGQWVMPTYYTDPETGKRVKSSEMFTSPEPAIWQDPDKVQPGFQHEWQEELGEFETQISPIPGLLESEIKGMASSYKTGKKAAEEKYGEWKDGEYLGGGSIEDMAAITGEWVQDEITGEWEYVEGTGGTGVETLETVKERAIEGALESAEEGQMALGGEYAGARAETSRALAATGMARHGGITSQFEDIESSIYGGIRGSGEQYAESKETAVEDYQSGMTDLSTKYSQTYETAKEKYDIELEELGQQLTPSKAGDIVGKYDKRLATALTGFQSGTGVALEQYLARIAGRKSDPYEAATKAIDEYRGYDPRKV